MSAILENGVETAASAGFPALWAFSPAIWLKVLYQRFACIGQVRRNSPTLAPHLAVCGDEVFVRDLKGIASHRWSKAAE